MMDILEVYEAQEIRQQKSWLAAQQMQDVFALELIDHENKPSDGPFWSGMLTFHAPNYIADLEDLEEAIQLGIDENIIPTAADDAVIIGVWTDTIPNDIEHVMVYVSYMAYDLGAYADTVEFAF